MARGPNYNVIDGDWRNLSIIIADLTSRIIDENKSFSDYILADGSRVYTSTGAGFKDEDDMVSDSAVATASQRSIKAYVDDEIVGALEQGTAQGQMSFWYHAGSQWTHTETSELVWDDTNKRLGIGVTDPDTLLELFKDGTQLKLSYDATSYNTFASDASGNLTIDSSDVSYTLDLGDGLLTTSGALSCGVITQSGTTLASTYHPLTTVGIAQNNLVKASAADVANGEYAKFTATGLESKTIGETADDLEGTIVHDNLATRTHNGDTLTLVTAITTTDLTVNNDFVISTGTMTMTGVVNQADAGETTIDLRAGDGAAAGFEEVGLDGNKIQFIAGSGSSAGTGPGGRDGGDGGGVWIDAGDKGLGYGAGDDGVPGNIQLVPASGGNVGIGYLLTGGITEKLSVNGSIWIQDNDKFLAGAGKDGEIYVASDHFHIHNVTEDMDLVFGIDDGGVSKTITWDADVDKLKHSAGLFDFDNDHLATSGYGQFGYASIGTGVSPVGTTYLTIGDLTTVGFDTAMDISILMSTDNTAKYALKFTSLNDYELWGVTNSQAVLFSAGLDVNPTTSSTLDVQRNILQGAGAPGNGTVITAGTHTWRALRLIANNADGTDFPTGGTFNIRPLEVDAPPDRYDGGTTVLNWTGIYINDATTNSPDTAWSIYSNGGDSYHKGDIAFGQTDKAERIGSDADGTLDLYAGTSIELHDATNIGDGTNELQISATGNVLLPAGAADAGRYPIKFQAGTALATPEAGVIEFNGGKFCITNVATCRVIDRTSDVIVSTKTVTATAVETEIWRGTMPANSLVAGNMFKFHADGVVTNDVATKDDITLRIYIGTIGDPGDAIVTLTPNTKALDGVDWHVNGNACQRTIGAAGSRAFHIHMKIGDPTAEGAEVFASGLGTVNTEIGLDIIVTVQWETDDVDNTISLYQGFLEYKN